MHDATLAEAQWPLHGRVSGIGELQVLGGQVAAVWRKFRAPKHSKRRILVRPVSAYAPPAVGLSTRAHPCGQVLSAPLPAGPVYSDTACKQKSAILPASAEFLERDGIVSGSLNLLGALSGAR